jgi:hypothetical protein
MFKLTTRQRNCNCYSRFIARAFSLPLDLLALAIIHLSTPNGRLSDNIFELAAVFVLLFIL